MLERMSSSATSVPQVQIRRATPDDIVACGQICYEAFATINRNHNFPPELPDTETATGAIRMLFNHPSFYCVVAEADGRIVGSNCLDERSIIAGIGPITVDPAAQNHRVGTMLMQAVLDRTREKGFPGTRLVQAAFHNRSLSLYTKLGFDAREPLSVMHGAPIGKTIPGYDVRPAQEADIAACNRVAEAVHGHDRAGEIRDSLGQKTALVVERHGAITGYVTNFGYFGHAVALSNLDLMALIAAAAEFARPGILVPTRNAELFRWCLNSGLRVVQPMTLMTMGMYNEPAGAYLPSVSF
jgi:predicted N-acetyltransferase YhbS